MVYTTPVDSREPMLIGERVLVRLPSSHDAKALAGYYRRNREFHRPTDPSRPEEFYTEAFWRQNIKVIRQEFADDRSVRLVMLFRSEPDRIVGVANFNQIFRGPLHACYLGYSLDELEQGQGVMTEALRLAVDYMFTRRNLHRIMANYMPDNERSARVLERLGFVIEGHAREYLLINGQWRDHVMTSLINPDWQTE